MVPFFIPSEGAAYRDAHLEIDFQSKAVRLDGRPLTLTRKEYDLLALLVQNAGDIMTRETLLWRVWSYGSQIRTRTLDVHIRRVRRKLAVYAEQYIETIFGVGYRFQPYRMPRTQAGQPGFLPLAASA